MEKSTKYENAVKYNKINFMQAIEQKLEVMDMTAFTMCQEFNIPIIVCNVMGDNNLKEIAEGQNVGTIIC